MSIRSQCELIGLARSNYYYEPKGWSPSDLELMRVIDEVYTEHPYYGTRRMSKALQSQDYKIGRKNVGSYYFVKAEDVFVRDINSEEVALGIQKAFEACT